MIRPVLQDEAFLAQVEHVRLNPEPDVLYVWWLGQMGYLICLEGNTLLLDPYLSDSLTRKYAQTDKPHVRMTERVIDPGLLGFVQIATASHAHTDHLDPDTLRPLVAANPQLILLCPESIRVLAEERSGLPSAQVLGFTDGQTQTVADWEFTGIASGHEALETDAAGRHLFLGFLIRKGVWNLYHSGDTVNYPGLSDRLRDAKLDLAFLPINGADPARRVAGNLSGEEAADLAHQAQIAHVVPGHFEMFEFNTASPDPFAARCRELGVPHTVLRAGEMLRLAR